ncbi:hypothetical protein BLNAU_22473 [Blattamonas nauphoetae]|uniref:Uncharacterized protein n=1 Tax=Blattamonas nauphoetae TaxID=2049346 RepID=A0ABQ9WSZ9_9EUKA|nr:hypothetical protein BLNAU_22473 [Blattamonas nauphoetae]
MLEAEPSYHNTANVKVTTGDFSSITSNLGTGAAIHAILQPSASFTISDYHGAGLHLFTEGRAGNFNRKALTFSENTASARQDIYTNSTDGGSEYFLRIAIFINETKGLDIAGYLVCVVAVEVLDGNVDASGTTIQPKSPSTTAPLKITAPNSISTAKTLSITNVAIDFSANTAPSNPLLSVSATGSLTLTNVAFSATSLLTAPTILSVVSGGTITANSFSVSSLSFSTAIVSIATSSISIGDISITSCSYTGSLSTPLLTMQLTAATTAQLNVGSITYQTTLLTASSNSFSSNTVLSFSGTSSDPVALLTMKLGSTFEISFLSSSLVFTPSTSASTPALADTTSSSLALSSTTINIFNLNGFYTTPLFAVPANALSIALASLSSPVIGISKMSTPKAVVSGGTMTLTTEAETDSRLAPPEHTCLQLDHHLRRMGSHPSECLKESRSDFSCTDEGTFTADASTSFAGCSAANGGAIAIDLTGRTGAGTFTLSGVTYGTPQNTAMTKGSDIFPTTPSSGTFFGTADLNKWYFVDSEPIEGSILYLLYLYNGGTLNVHSSSTAITSTLTVEYESDSTHRTITLSAGVGGSLSVKSSEFSSIESRGAGSAIKAVLNTGQTLSLTGVTFTSCSSLGNGGALLVLTTGNGNKLYLSSSTLSTIIRSSALTTLKPASLPITKAATHTHPNGAKHANSKNSFILDAALTMAHAHSINSNVILWSSTTNLPITVTAGTFTIPSGTLTLKSLGFTGQNTNMTFSFVTVSGTGWTGGVISVALTTLHFTVDGIASFSDCPPGNGGAIVVDLTSSAETVTFTLLNSMGDSVPTEGSILYLLLNNALNDGNRLAHSTSNANDACIDLLSDVSTCADSDVFTIFILVLDVVLWLSFSEIE